MDYRDDYYGLYRDYCRDPFPQELILQVAELHGTCVAGFATSLKPFKRNLGIKPMGAPTTRSGFRVQDLEFRV